MIIYSEENDYFQMDNLRIKPNLLFWIFTYLTLCGVILVQAS